MSIPYRIVQRSNPRDLDQPKRYYAQARIFRNVDHISLCKSASYGRSVIPSELIAAFEAVMVRAIERITEGDSVTLPGLGTFRAGLRGIGADTEAEFHEGLIRSAHIVFTPHKDFKTSVRSCGVMKCKLGPVKGEADKPIVPDPDETPGA